MVNPLEKLAEIQLEHTNIILLVGTVLTVVLSLGIPKINLMTDFQDSLSDSIEPIEAQEKVETQFGNINSIIVLMETNDKPKQEAYVTDIRDPRVIHTLDFLTKELEREGIVSSANSMSSLFGEVPETKEQVKQRLEHSDASFTNRDFTATTMFVELEGKMSEDNIEKATRVIEENLDETPQYPGLKTTLTGTPVIRSTLSDVLISDSITTILLASLFILGLLTITRGIVYGPTTFVPLFVGLVWTLGFMGHFGIPLSFATISLGSMILGLGVEYGSFITERILEEVEEMSLEESVKTAIPTTGKAILGSAMTDGVGFMALLFAYFSFLRDLGVSLALGEFLTVSSALVITPSLIITYRRWKYA